MDRLSWESQDAPTVQGMSHTAPFTSPPDARQDGAHQASLPVASDTVVVRPAHTRQDCAAIGNVLNEVWIAPPTDPVYPDGVLLTFAGTGLCVAGAYQGDRCVGAVVGFLGWEQGRLTARLDYMGVLDGLRDRGIADGLWQYFFDWAKATAADVATWTFDPTSRRNAHLYLTKYGARVDAYKPDVYGDRTDGLNAGDPSDRLLAVVSLTRDLGEPMPPQRWVDLPHDYEQLPADDARAARNVLRRQLLEAVQAGSQIVCFDRDLGYGLA
jgi:predicted GNAT superfamily acetyltransferase